jgi:hypothetical protein
MKTAEFLIEAKSTIHDSIKLDRDFFLKISHEARFSGKTPALTISFVNGDGSPKRDGEWVCLPLSYLDNIINI